MSRREDGILDAACRTKVSRLLIVVILTMLIMPVMGCAYVGAKQKRERIVDKVPIISQFPELPTGCEATSIAMLLRWYGLNVSKEEVARALPKGCIPKLKDAKLYGGNPNLEFVGDPFSKAGYGIYHGPVAGTINKYLPDKAEDITGISFEELLRVIEGGRPVIVWATIKMAPVRISKVWYDSSGNKVVWRVPEHTVVIVGYTDTHVIVNDPWSGKRQHYPISTFKDRWQRMGKQAVTIRKG